MKKNHEQVIGLIQKAIASCGYDSVFSETKTLLSRALASASEVAKKRSRNVSTQKALELGKAKQQEWWDMLKKNAAKNAEFDMPEDVPNE